MTSTVQTSSDKLNEIVVKSKYSTNEREFSLKGNDLNFDNLQRTLKKLFDDLPDLFKIKYRDDDGDLITIGSQKEFEDALEWKMSKTNPSSPILHLFVLTVIPRENSTVLHGISELFMKMSINSSNNNNNNSNDNDKIMEDAATNSNSTTSTTSTTTTTTTTNDNNNNNNNDNATEKKPKKLKEKSTSMAIDFPNPFIVGSRWIGTCKDTSSSELFPMEFNVIEIDKSQVQGTIVWPSLNGAVTKYLGVIDAKGAFKFREYEIVRGKEDVEVPNNYVCQVNGNTIEGGVKKTKSEIKLQFDGIQTSAEGFLSFFKLNPDVYKSKKRTYDLVTNDSTERPTVDDQRAAFKKLVRNSEFWYDRTVQGKLEPRSKEELRKEVRQSCECGNPMFETPSKEDPKKMIMACSRYPHCQGRTYLLSYYYDSDEYYSDDS